MKTWLLFLGIICIHGMLAGQEVVITLTSPHNGGETYDYQARDEVRLKPGFLYSPQGANLLHARIDEDMVLPVSYSDEPIGADERELNLSLPVGTTAGSFDVSATGAATYTIPIAVPPGTAGMQPQLAVGYSSQSGNGMLGMGWNLQGLSMITRTGTTLYHDGYIDGVDFDNNDAYAWNGQRLLLMENLANGDVRYATEAESYTRIIAHGTSGNGPLKWTVITKDGTEMQYGYTEDARHQEQNSASVVRWMMNKVTDRRGNYMKYHYLEDNHTGTWRPDYIEYTGNAKANPDLIPYNKVKFYYGIRSDSTLAFVGGTQIKNNLLLRKIRTFAEGDFAREYRFTYFKDEFASFLNEITETSFTGERLNSTVVGWGEKSVDSLQAHETEIPYYICPDPLDCSHELTQMVRGDYNGDGVDDVFLVYKPLTSYTWLFKWYDFKNETLHHYETLNVYEMGCLGISFQSADFNGDGYDDLLRSWKQDESPDWEGVDIFINNKSGGDYAFTWLENAGNDSIPSVSLDDSPRFYAIDLDGDGQSEIIRFFKDRSGTGNYIAQVYEVTELGSPFQATLVASKSFDNTNLFSPFEFIDFNGNGTQELIHVKNISPEEQFFSYELNNETMQLEKIFSSGYPSEWHKRFYGDFNGDGNTDILTYHEDHGWELGYSTGKTFIIQDFCPIDDDFDPELNYNDTYTMDINGDGFCDIVTTCPSANNDLFIIHYSHGSSFTTDTVFLPHNLIELYDNITYHGDFNGDGTQEFLFAPWNIYDNFFLRLQIETPENADKVVAITNGLNQKLKIEYQKLLVDNDFYSRDNTNLADVREIAGPIAAVKKTEFDLGDENNNYYSTYYNYKSLKMHLRGKGMLGMTTFTTHNTLHNTKSIAYFGFNTDYYFARLDSAQQYGGNNARQLLQATRNTYQTLAGQATGIFIHRPIKNVAVDYLTKNTVTSEYLTFDAYGNITQAKTTQASNGNIAGTQTTTTTYTGAVSNPSGCDYLPDFTTTTYARPGEASISNSTQYFWGADGKPWIEVAWRNTPKAVTTFYTEYNAFGTPTGISLSADDVEIRYSNVTYDSKGRYPVTKTDAMGFTENMQYDHRTGQVIKATDINGLVTQYQYDGFGRTRLTEFPDGLTLQKSMQWDLNSTISNACYYTTSTLTGSPPQKVWYDRLGREILAQSIGFAGQPVNVKTLYDTKGRLWKTSEPYADGTTATQFTLFDYDALGRNYQTTLPTGVKQVTNYAALSQNQITTYASYSSDTWQTVTKTMNAFGEPVSITDEGGTITYQYYSNGLPRSITANGSTIAMTYDLHGNRTTLDDPDAGLITTVYNNFDELTSQTDARQNTYTMTYDKLGRITTRSGPYNELTTWDYENTQAGKLGQLNGVTMNNGTAQAYTYDALGRVATQTETTGSQEFTKTYSYDALGRLQNEYWHTGFGIEYQYNNWGYMSQVNTWANELIWQGSAYNARGQATSYNLGSQYQVVREYDAWGFPKRIKTMKSGNPSEIENLYYTFDFKRGNLTQRGTLKYYRWDIFTYDALDRLNTETETISGNALATSYADNGNILTRSDVGTYAYSQTAAGPHAVTGITDAAGTLLPEHNQSVSYTPFNKVSHISQRGYDYFITYGSDRLRRRTSLHTGIGDDVLLTKYYAFGDYERETTPAGTRHLHYIQGGDGLAAVYVKNEGGADSLYLIMKDHLGSIIGAINQETGTVYLQNFDAWGRKRNPENWTYDDIPEYFPLSRGYAGHEHLDKFGLINMNGRMYDAALCRFLSPDPYVQMPDYSQNLNRYSYALNNPLVFTDPTGEFPIVFAIGFIVGAYLGGLSSNDWKLNPREWEMNTNTFLAMGFGGLAGGFGGQYLLGAGGVLSGGTPLNVAIGSNIGNTFNAGANFVVSNGSVMLQGLGYTTAAGGGAYYLINQNQGQNYQQMVDQEIYNVQEKYSNAWFQNEPGYKPADLGAIDYLDQMSYSLSYAKRFGYGMEIQEIFDFSNASVNFQNTPSWGASRWSVENPAYSINLFDGGDKVSHTFSGLRFLAEGGSNLNSNYLSYGSANLSIDKFPKYNIYGDRLPYPYGIQIMGFVGDSRKTIGTFRFNNWNDFRNFNMKIFNGPPKGYWFK